MPKPHEQSYPTISADTDPAAEQVQLAILRTLSPAQKVLLIFEAIEASRQLALIGLRHRHPNASPDELRRRLFGLELGEELATKVYGPLPPGEAGETRPTDSGLRQPPG